MKNNVYYKRLRDLREDNDKTQKEIAELCLMKQQQYARYEIGIIDIPTDILIKLCEYYKVSADYILELSDTEEGGLTNWNRR